MSNVVIKKLMQTQMNASNGASPPLVYENMAYNPVAGTAWQRADFLFAQTENPTMGDGFKRKAGILQIMLHYPLHAGAGAADARGDFWCDVFKRGVTFTEGTLRVLIYQAPWATTLPKYDSWHRVAVSVPFVADVHG